MLCDSEVTNRDTVERSPFLLAYLELDDRAFRSIRVRGELMAALEMPGADRKDVCALAVQLLADWEAAEQAERRMAEAKHHQEQAITDLAARLLDQNAEATADALAQVAYRFIDKVLLDRTTKLRERAQLRRSAGGSQPAPEPVQP